MGELPPGGSVAKCGGEEAMAPSGETHPHGGGREGERWIRKGERRGAISVVIKVLPGSTADSMQ
jgi:hypothetical protein